MFKSFFKIALVVLLVIAMLALSFMFTSGLVYLISLCFDFTFTWKLSTGIWLVLMLLGRVPRTEVKNGHSH